MDIIDLTERLVGFETVSQKNSTKQIADFISNYLEPLGFKITQYPYADKNGLAKVNLVARMGGEEGAMLALAGHMDTVPAGPWKTTDNPLSLNKIRDNYHGLGVADMKCFLAIAMKAAEKFSWSTLKKPLALCFTSDEEVGCEGAKRLVDKVGKIADYVVIGEPTNMRPIYLHKGYMYLEITVGAFKDEHVRRGENDNPCHSSDPRTTTNVVEKAMPAVIEAMSEFKKRLEEVVDARFTVSFPTMNIAPVITVGRKKRDDITSFDKVAKNIIPRGFSMEMELRPVPGQDVLELKQLVDFVLKDVVGKIKPEVSDERIEIRADFKRGPTPPMETDKNSKIIDVVERISGFSSESALFNTEGGIYNSCGSQTVIWGPADIRQAHNYDEFISVNCLSQSVVDAYVSLIREFCC